MSATVDAPLSAGLNMASFAKADAQPWNNELRTGTTIMAVEFDKGVVIAADSRTTMGAYIANRVTDKLTPLSDHIFCCRSGSAADTQAIADIVRARLYLHELQMNEQPAVSIAANMFREICYENRESISAGIIVAGWDPVEGGQVFSIPLGGFCQRQSVAIGGSGSTYLYGFIDANYKPGMNQQECLDFCKKAITLAILRDGSSGGVCRMAALTNEGAKRFLYRGNELQKFDDTF